MTDSGVGAGRLVLVVEDDRSTLAFLAQALRQGGFQVLTSSDPLQGFALALREKPAVIVSDMQMPAGGGDAFLRRLQASNRTSSVPVVVVTGSLGPEDRERLVGSGLSAVLTKPVEPAQLVAAVAAAAGA
jgi:CheY-like chemotaxis protein